MKSQPSTTATQTPAPDVAEHPAAGMLGLLAFVLLAVVLCVRALLDEDRTVAVTQLVTPPEVQLSASLMARHLVHLLTVAGIGLGAMWILMTRRTWRVGPLELGSLVLVGAALLSVPVASDRRLAMNTAVDVILPMLSAAALYQLLVHRPIWRRVLLAAIVATAAANCFKATAQQGWEYRQGWHAYQQNKAQFWSLRGVSLDDPAVAAFEASRRGIRPRGFIQGINVLSSFLLLGLTAIVAGLVGGGIRRVRPGSIERNRGKEPSTDAPPPPKRVALLATLLLVMAAWHLVMLCRIRTLGVMVGMVVAIAVVAIGLRLADRPKRLAVLLASGMVLLQTGLIVLALTPPSLHRALLNNESAGGKIKTIGLRLPLWEGSLRLFLADPFTGIGPSQLSKHYLAVRSVHSRLDAVGSHSWLLNTAAEWGVFGVLGVLIALGGAGWHILRSLARPPDETNLSTPSAALLPAMLVVLACWLVVASDLARSQWGAVLAWPMAISFAAAALVSFSRLRGRAGQLILLAGLVGFVVHCTVDETSNVVGAMWPFWAMVALAMAWNGPVASTVQTPGQRWRPYAGLVVVGAAVVVVVVLTMRPLHAVRLMHQAQRAAVANQPRQAVELFRSAAAADRLDPLPLKAAAFLRYRLAQSEPRRALEHLRDYAELSRAAVERNPLDHGYWRTLGLANMFLATVTSDFVRVDEAIRNMQRALELNPQWPVGWLELARMAAVEGDQPDRPTLLKTALAAADKALEIEDGRVGGLAPTLSPQDRAELLAVRKQVLRRLQIAEARSAATQLAR